MLLRLHKKPFEKKILESVLAFEPYDIEHAYFNTWAVLLVLSIAVISCDNFLIYMGLNENKYNLVYHFNPADL